MRRRLVVALGMLVGTTSAVHAVDLAGTWFICEDCRVGGVCDPSAPPPPGSDTATITQTGTDLSIHSMAFNTTFTGTIDVATGAFDVPHPPNAIAFDGVGTFSTIDGTYDSQLQQGHVFGGRECDPMAPTCDDGDSCTDDACVTTTVGTCSATSVAVCVNTPNGSCSTTTSTSTTTTTSSSTIPPGHYPVTGRKLVLKKSSSGRETLIFVTSDPTVLVPAFGGPDDPTLVTTQIELYSPVASSGSFAIAIPPGVGKPGWSTSPTPSAMYLFKNPDAPAGISVVRTVKLRAGRGLKIVGRATGLPMTTPLGAAGIIVRFDDLSGGLPIMCAHFGASSVRKGTPPVFIAGPSPAPTNCYGATLSGP